MQTPGQHPRVASIILGTLVRLEYKLGHVYSHVETKAVAVLMEELGVCVPFNVSRQWPIWKAGIKSGEPAVMGLIARDV